MYTNLIYKYIKKILGLIHLFAIQDHTLHQVMVDEGVEELHILMK